MTTTDEQARLAELTAAYKPYGLTHSFWAAHDIDLDRFRGYGQFNTPGYMNARLVEYITSLGADRYLKTLKEDGAFGCFVEMVNGRMVSRDLLESIIEIHFLSTRGLLAPGTTILDIGAGYGRLAHWLTRAVPETTVYAADAIPASTLVCEKYIQFRRNNRVKVVPLHELDAIPTPDLAVNIHSWSECTLPAIRWWLQWLAAREVPRLFLIPHTSAFTCMDTGTPSFRPELSAFGYVLQHAWFSDPTVDRSVQGPRGYYLFARKNTPALRGTP